MQNNSSWTKCFECDRGGRGNAKEKCSCGWQTTTDNNLGCYLGTPIVGEPVKPTKMSRSKKRYLKYLDMCDSFDSFKDFLLWESEKK